MSSEKVSAEITIEAPVERVKEVLLDIDAYPEWAKAVTDARVLDYDPELRPHHVEFHVSPGPLPKMRYILRYVYGPSTVGWEYVEGDLRDLHGAYQLEPSADQTRVTYELLIDPGSMPLPGFVKARATREIARVALDDLKRRVESLW